MKCDLSKEKLIGYLYEDLPDEDIEDVKVHLKKCPACKKELAEFSKTADILGINRNTLHSKMEEYGIHN